MLFVTLSVFLVIFLNVANPLAMAVKLADGTPIN